MDYNFREIEAYWRSFWAENQTFKVEEDTSKEKFYVLDMFPYPSGAGLHVGHPLGYIASDIYARYKRLKGFNVLHPMGYDSFGLPAEQYAIQTGQRPEITTKTNIDGGVDNAGNAITGYRKQLDILGFSFDWSREVRTSSPEYYKWTQWIFKQIFDSYYNNSTDKAESIHTLISIFATEGNANVNACTEYATVFSASEWNASSEKEKEDTLQEYRLAYLADSWVNWCPALGTVLANDEVVNGVSERGGHPVEQKLMRQWSMRIKAYANRLLTGLDGLDWTDSIKDQQRNWIGKSVGCSVRFKVAFDSDNSTEIEVFTTRPDTIFGVSFMVLAPEHPLVDQITTDEFKEGIANYKKEASLKSERDRQSDVKNISGQNTGAFAIHPFTGEKIQIWIGDYVLASYGTGAVMAVPCGDQRDYDFAKHFNIEIPNIFQDIDISETAYAEKDATIANSDFLNGLAVKDATKKAVAEIEKRGIGKGKIQYRLRDAIFSRQRYWGEPFPLYYENGIPKTIHERDLPIILPEVEKYLPTEDGQPPLGNSPTWAWNVVDSKIVDNINIDNKTVFPIELNTMPGWAGSSWYFLRYMDPTNNEEFVSKEKVDYWKNVDLYIGGSEHATGHLLYSRFWTKFLNDMGHIPFDEPFQKMINQGMILGRSSFVYAKYPLGIGGGIGAKVEMLTEDLKVPVFISEQLWVKAKDIDSKEYEIIESRLLEYQSVINKKLKERNPKVLNWVDGLEMDAGIVPIHVDISMVNSDKLDIEAFKNSREEYKNAEFILEEDGTYMCGHEIEKMSKSKYNVQTPDELVEKFGADTLRMYEMFLGPIEQAKPWDTKGITGVHNFLRKLWRLFHDQNNELALDENAPSKEALKTLHKTIKKITDDLERYSFNTGVSNFMICVNELTEQKCNNKAILKELVVLLSSYAPHICEELWVKLGNEAGTLSYTTFPTFNPAFMEDDSYSYPVSFNGKMRFVLDLDANLGVKEIEEAVMQSEQTLKYLEGKTPKKVIIVPKKIVNLVV
jgi:leucyl-tRNA synthetase